VNYPDRSFKQVPEVPLFYGFQPFFPPWFSFCSSGTIFLPFNGYLLPAFSLSFFSCIFDFLRFLSFSQEFVPTPRIFFFHPSVFPPSRHTPSPPKHPSPPILPPSCCSSSERIFLSNHFGDFIRFFARPPPVPFFFPDNQIILRAFDLVIPNPLRFFTR